MTDITITPPEVITVTATSPTAYTITVTQPAAITVTATSESHLPVTIGTANGLTLATQTLSLGLSSAGVTGALSGADWSTFNAKAGLSLTNTFTQPQTITTSQDSVTGSYLEIENTSAGTNAGAQLFVQNNATYWIQNMVFGSGYASTYLGLSAANMAAMNASTIGPVVYGNVGAGSVHVAVNATIATTTTSAGDFGVGTQTPDFAGFGKTITVFSATSSSFEAASSRTSGVIGALVWASTGNTTLKEVGGVYGFVDGATANNRGMYMAFYTKADAGTEVERLRIGSTGLITVGSAGGGTGRFNVIGSTDIIQTITKAHSTQTASIQEWQTSAAAVLVKISGTGVLFPVQAATASAPAYVKGGIYFDTTLNKLRIGGATAWETVTSS